jgi:hypothetical protein
MKIRSCVVNVRAMIVAMTSASAVCAVIAFAADPSPTAAGKSGDVTPGAAKPAAMPTPYGVTKVSPFTETTNDHGKIDQDLSGVWLLVASVELAPERFRTFPQLLKITKGEGGLEVHMVDVRLPQPMQQSIREARFSLWQPSEEMLATLRKSWADLPKYESKAVGEMIYQKITYTFASPDQYATAFQIRDPKLDKILKNSRFALSVSERYLPHELPSDTRVSQLMGRDTFYAIKSTEPGLIKGKHRVNFLAAGAGVPVPYNMGGSFVMYRIASLS